MKAIVKFSLTLSLLAACVPAAAAQAPQTAPLSNRAAVSVLSIWPDGAATAPGAKSIKWSYDQGVLLKGVEASWMNSGDGRLFKYMQMSMDRFVESDGTIRTYKPDEYNIDHVLNGRVLLTLYKVTGQDKYRKAAALLREQLKTHPRTKEGGFWHKKIYPWQMWLDGLYMGQPFMAEYAALFHEPAAYDDIARQFVWMEKNSRDAKTGLLYHGWDESREQKWADKTTGRSPNFWGRAMGWYAMALVDTLDHFPANHPGRAELVAILGRLAKAVEKYQEPKSGLWYDVLDKGQEKGNYFESSAAAMFVYALSKGVRLGHLPASYMKVAEKAYRGMNEQFIRAGADGVVNFEKTVAVSGLGGNPYRDGSYAYYLSERVITNDPKGYGAFLVAVNEMEMAAKQATGRGKVVLLDSHFNNEWKKDALGVAVPWHYTWEEMANGGFSLWGHVFRAHGARTATLDDAPTAANLRGASVYIIVDPDTEKETERPNYVRPEHAKAVAEWVRAGGVLVLMGNDAANAEFDHFNTLAAEFGIRFNKDQRNPVLRDEFSMGRLAAPAGHPVFTTARNLFLKEISTLALAPPARSVFDDQGHALMAVAKAGKGTVFAVGDPWLYNEYTDGRKLPAEFDNYEAMHDLAVWLLRQSPAKGR